MVITVAVVTASAVENRSYSNALRSGFKLSHPSNSSRFSMSDILGKLCFLPVVSLKSGRIWATCARFLEDAFLSLLPRARTQKYVPSLNVSLLYQFLFLWFTHCKYYLIRFLLALCKRSEVF